MRELSKYGVTELYKIKRKEDGILKNTGTIILTFDLCEIPSFVKIGWTTFEVRKYIPNPRQCYHCQKFNHSAKTCRAEEGKCSRCGEAGHAGPSCTNPPNCANCDGAHKASDRNCPHYKIEKEIITLQTLNKIGYREAKKEVLQRQITPTLSYSDILRSAPARRTENLPRQKDQTKNKEKSSINSNQHKRNLPSDSEESNPKKTAKELEVEQIHTTPWDPKFAVPLLPPTTPPTTQTPGKGTDRVVQNVTGAGLHMDITPPGSSQVTSDARAQLHHEPKKPPDKTNKSQLDTNLKSIPSLGHNRDPSRSRSRDRYQKY